MPRRSAPRPAAAPTPPDGDRPLRARGRATRAKLLDAGVDVFSRKGFHATRVDDIVTRAATSHGTFYLYFASKDALFEQLVADITAEFATLADAIPVVTTTAESRAALEAWLVSFIGAYAHYGPLIRSWTEAERGSGSEDGAGGDVLATVATALTAKVKVRKRKDLDPAIASLAIVAMVERVNYFLATGQLTDDAEAVAHTLAGIALDALFGPGAHG